MFEDTPLVMVPQPEIDLPFVEVEAANTAEDVQRQLVALRQADEKSFLMKGKLMKIMRDQKHYRTLGYRDLEDFCLQVLKYGGRQVRTFVRVYEKFVEKMRIDEQRLIDVGSTKLVKMVDVVDEENIDSWISYAKQNNVADVENRVHSFLGTEKLDRVEEEQTIGHAWNVILTPAQRDFINETLELAKQANGSEWTGAALEMICADFQAGLGRDATRVTLSFQVTEQEKNILGVIIDQAREKGFQSVGALLTAGAEKLFGEIQ